MHHPGTLVVLPAYNEEEALPKSIASLRDALPDGFHVLIVNDGSSDRTGAVAETLSRRSTFPLHVIHLSCNSGVGAAMQTGFRFAGASGNYDYVIQFDADGQHDAMFLGRMVEECERKDLDLCIGSRFLSDPDQTYRSTPSRILGARLISFMIGLCFGVRITDPTGGFRCMGRRCWSRFADDYPEEYAEPESLFWCLRKGFRVTEIPVRMHPRQGGTTSMRFSNEVYYMLKVFIALLCGSAAR